MSFSTIRRSDLKVGKVLAVGGFSTVYEAKYKERDVAAKRPNSPDYNEIQVMSKLDHENIVKLLAVVDEHPDFYLVLELCDGGSLRKYLDKRAGRRLPKDQLYDWAEQAAKPIEYLREIGVIHKDIKSDNYVIATGNILKLTDFGLAKEKISATIKHATQGGTPGYMAPEVWKEFLLSPTYDIFSYGTVLWELFTTETPFQGDEGFAIVYKVCHENECPPIPSDCPEALADLMKRCWEVDTKQRPTIGDILSVIRCSRTDILRFLIVGATGVGKSTVGNSILGAREGGHPDPPFRAKMSPASVTKEVQTECADVLGRKVYIIDTPDLFEMHYLDQQQLKSGVSEVKRTIFDIARTPNPSAAPIVVLLVVRVGRFTPEISEHVDFIKKFLVEDLVKFLILVFSHTDQFELEGEESLDMYVHDLPEFAQRLLGENKNRYVGFNSRHRPTSEENKQQVQKLFTIAEETRQNSAEFIRSYGGDTMEATVCKTCQGTTLDACITKQLRCNSNGGIGSVPDVDVTLMVPRDAVTESTRILVAVDPCEQQPRVDKNQLVLGPVISCKPDGLKFQKPVTITVPHSGVHVTQRNLQVWCKREPPKAPWQNVFNGSTDTDSTQADVGVALEDNRIKLRVTHFTLYAFVTAPSTPNVPDGVELTLDIFAYKSPVCMQSRGNVCLRVYAVKKYNVASRKLVEREERSVESAKCCEPTGFVMKPNGNILQVHVRDIDPEGKWMSAEEKSSGEIVYDDIQRGGIASRCEIKFRATDAAECPEWFQGCFDLRQEGNATCIEGIQFL